MTKQCLLILRIKTIVKRAQVAILLSICRSKRVNLYKVLKSGRLLRETFGKNSKATLQLDLSKKAKVQPRVLKSLVAKSHRRSLSQNVDHSVTMKAEALMLESVVCCFKRVVTGCLNLQTASAVLSE
jgi:hypothetical protein